MVDLAALRDTIIVAGATGVAATVTREFLVQVEREIREGRAAKAELDRRIAIEAVTEQLGTGASSS